MATYQTRKGKTKTSVTATVRKHGKSISRTFPSKAKARAWAGEIEGAIDAKKFNDPRLAEKVSLEAALDKYHKVISAKKAKTTYQVDGRSINALKKGLAEILARDTAKDISLAEITPRVVASYRDHRQGEVSDYSVRREMALLSHLFQKARREWELPVANPVDDVDRPKAPRGRTRFLNIEEGQRLMTKCDASRNKKLGTYILTLLQTGMRPSEAARLQWGQVDLDGMHIYLDETKTDERTVPITAAVCARLSTLKQEGAGEADLVFLTKEQMALPRFNRRPSLVFRGAWTRARTNAKLQDVHMHDLRHTAGSWMLARGVDVRIIAGILGHATLQMVMRYTHVVSAAARSAIDTIGDLGIKKPSAEES